MREQQLTAEQQAALQALTHITELNLEDNDDFDYDAIEDAVFNSLQKLFG